MASFSTSPLPSNAQAQPAGVHGRGRYEYLSLYKAALSGDWVTAESILEQDPAAAEARLTYDSQTTLHVAVGTGKSISFVANLVSMMHDDSSLALTDNHGNNALHIAAMTGNTAAATILVARLPDLLYVTSIHQEYLPVHSAAMYGHKDTLDYLISKTEDYSSRPNPYDGKTEDYSSRPNPYDGESGLLLLNIAIRTGYLDIALKLVNNYPDLAKMRLPSMPLTLHEIANNDAIFASGARFNFWERLIYSSVQLKMTSQTQHAISNSGNIVNPITCANSQRWHMVQFLHSSLCKVIKLLVPHIKEIHDKKLMHHQAIELVKCLCKHMEWLSDNEAQSIYVDAMVAAAVLGNHEVIEMIVETCPDAIYSRDLSNGRSIFHLAVENRCEKVFNLIYQMSDHKLSISDPLDTSGNTLLHLAGSLAPPHKLNLVSGAALQMQRELQWFKEVEKFARPYARGNENYTGKTPKMIFTEEHKDLKVEGEKWMKDTANSCTIAAALIATVVFAAAITVPGGNESETGYPMFSKSIAFIIFAYSDAISLFTSTTSLLMFLSILTSRYAEEDFLFALPKRLCIGLITLFVSISFMIAAFSATIFLVFGRMHAWVLIPVATLACLPVSSFVLLQFPLLVDVVSSTYGRGIFGKQSDRSFY